MAWCTTHDSIQSSCMQWTIISSTYSLHRYSTWRRVYYLLMTAFSFQDPVSRYRHAVRPWSRDDPWRNIVLSLSGMTQAYTCGSRRCGVLVLLPRSEVVARKNLHAWRQAEICHS